MGKRAILACHSEGIKQAGRRNTKGEGQERFSAPGQAEKQGLPERVEGAALFVDFSGFTVSPKHRPASRGPNAAQSSSPSTSTGCTTPSVQFYTPIVAAAQ
jgi:hypothetical protein